MEAEKSNKIAEAGTWTAVVNPHAGGGRTLHYWRKAQMLLETAGIGYEAVHTDCKYHAVEIAFDAAGRGCRKFIAVGGDGTVHEVLDGIMTFLEDSVNKGLHLSLNDFTLAVLPIGSGNDWIKAHNLPLDIKTAVELIAANSFSMQDVVRMCVLDPECGYGARILRKSYMINIGGIGFDARICERVNMQKDRGRKGKFLYVKSLLYNLMKFKPFPVEIECDGKVIFSGQCYSVAFGNGQYSGGGMRQTPDAIVDDGLLDVTVIPPFSIFRILREAPKLFTGRLLTVKELVTARARSVLVRVLGSAEARLSGRPAAGEIVEIDGEVVGKVPVKLDVWPEKINVLHRFL